MFWEAGETFPPGPVIVYEGSVGGAVPEPSNGTEVLSIWSVPLASPTTTGVNVIANWDVWPAARASGSAGAATVNGLLELVLVGVMLEIVVEDVPELVMVNVTFSDWDTWMGLKTTALGGTTGMVPALDV